MGFPGGGMGNMQAMMKKVQKMQADMMKKQEEIKSKTIETTAGGGAVAVVVNGKKEIVSLTIKPEACDPDDVEMLQDMLITAINDGMKQIDDYSEKEMAKVTGGMKLPGM